MINQTEQKLLTVLYGLRGDTIFHLSIDSVRKSKNPDREKMLIDQLRSQAMDNLSSMERIIGKEAFELLMNQTPETA